MSPTTPRRRFHMDASRNPIPYAFLAGTSFIGIWWLIDPLFARIGWAGDGSRPHMLFVGTFFAVVMTWVARRGSPSDSLSEVTD